MLCMYLEIGCTVTCNDIVRVVFTIPFVRFCEFFFLWLLTAVKKIKPILPIIAFSSSI